MTPLPAKPTANALLDMSGHARQLAVMPPGAQIVGSVGVDKANGGRGIDLSPAIVDVAPEADWDNPINHPSGVTSSACRPLL